MNAKQWYQRRYMGTHKSNTMDTIIIAFLFLLMLLWPWISKTKNSSVLTNWPVVGMLPTVLSNLNRFHDKVTETLAQSGGTLKFKGPWFSNMDVLITCDPKNTHYILSKCFPNYGKGANFIDTYEPLGDGIIAAEAGSWALQRKMVHSFFTDPKMGLFLERTIQEKVVEKLYPVLDHVCDGQVEVNLSDVLLRLGFDMNCSVILGCDPQCLSFDFPEVAHERAIHDMSESVLYRIMVPDKYWKLLKRIQVGQEKKLSEALNTFDRFVYKCIEAKKTQINNDQDKKETQFDFLTAFLTKSLVKEEDCPASLVNSNKFLRDLSTSLAIAGRDTSSAALSWLFYLLAKNPSVETKILDEIERNLDSKNVENDGVFGVQEVNKLVYLHATLCETLRLYPSIPVNHKTSVQADTLPSGHRVGANTRLFISYYAMARMRDVWGDDCLEFKPERWISEKGKILHVPSYKFSAFSSGPRTCPGKNMSFVHMKIVTVAIMLKYKFHLVEDHPVRPDILSIIHMKDGMKVRVTKKKGGTG